jgi:RHS repeat-associated protein
MNQSGGPPDDADIAAFFAFYAAGDDRADFNGSGGTPDESDVALFFQVWDAGIGQGTPDDNRFGWRGYLWDARLGLYHVRHRVYDPRHAAWLTPDPAGYLDGLNLYAYCRGDLVNQYDPYGLWSFGPLDGIGEWVYDTLRDFFYGDGKSNISNNAEMARRANQAEKPLNNSDVAAQVAAERAHKFMLFAGEAAELADSAVWDTALLGGATGMAYGARKSAHTIVNAAEVVEDSGGILAWLRELFTFGGDGHKVGKTAAIVVDNVATSHGNRTTRKGKYVLWGDKIPHLDPGESLLPLRDMSGAPVVEQWLHNREVLLRAMDERLPIRDSHVSITNNGKYELTPRASTSFLTRERNLLESERWWFDPTDGYWKPPSGTGVGKGCEP